jgi:hypothetical protein
MRTWSPDVVADDVGKAAAAIVRYPTREGRTFLVE